MYTEQVKQFGSAVRDGELRFLSVSAVERADACLRDWYYTYVEGRREEQSTSQARGTKLHKQTADYLTTGVKTLDSQIIRGLHMLPPPGKDLFVEHPLAESLETAPLRAADVPFIGAIDLMHERHINYGGSDIEDTTDPEDTVEVADHKFPSRMTYTKQNHELPKLIQMAGYGTYTFIVSPSTRFVRLSHNYFPVSGNPRKATIRVDREALVPTWDKVVTLTRSIKDAAKEKDPNRVDADTRSCERYGRKCMHASYCSAAMHNSLSSLIGITAASRIIKDNNTMALIPKSEFKPSPMQKSLLAQMKPAVDVELEKLKAEEAEAKKRQKEGEEKFLTACTKVMQFGRGFPKLVGEASKFYASAGGQSPTDEYPGNGELGSITIDEPDMVFQLLNELADTSPPLPALLPPDVPEPAKVEAYTISTDAPVNTSIPTVTIENPLASVTAEPKKRGRKPKSDPVQVAETTMKESQPAENSSSPNNGCESRDGGCYFYVDCIAMGGEFKRFEPFVTELHEDLCKELNAADIRCAPSDGPAGYGRWPGIVAAAARERIATLTPGHYVLDARGNQLAEIVAEAARDVCLNKGWTFVRGMR